MANALFPSAGDGQSHSQEAHAILDEMIAKGNRLAAARKAELTHLEVLFGELAARIERRGLQTLTLFSPVQNEDETEIVNEGSEEQQDAVMPVGQDAIPLSISRDPSSRPGSDIPPVPSDLEFLDSIGISSDEFLSIVNQMAGLEGNGVLDTG